MKITKHSFLSAPSFFFIYMFVLCLGIISGRYFSPAEEAPLRVYLNNWRLLSAFLSWFDLFPALAFSGLVLPFALQKSPDEHFKSFSPRLLDYLKPWVVTGIVAVLIYGILFFLAAPLARDRMSTMRYQGYLFTQSKARAEESAAEGDWPATYQLFRICQWIWPDSPETESLKEKIEFGMDSWRFASLPSSPRATDTTTRAPHRLGVELSVTEALELADVALRERRYFDAHWLAMLGEHLTKQGSDEEMRMRRIASLAWDALDRLTPSEQERREYVLYHQKREGYSAMVAEDWIRAYYIFKSLAPELPDDPDVTNFFALSEAATIQSAFFIDEMEERVGELTAEAIFSLPLEDGARSVLRVTSLSSMPDFAYGIGLELIASNPDGTLKYRVKTPYAKLRPFNIDGKNKMMIMLRGLNREHDAPELEPVWEGSETASFTGAEIALDLSYDDFMLLTRLRRGLDALSINELYTAATKFGDYGYIPEVFQADILYRLGEPGAFLPLVIFIIIIGWRFRALRLPHFLILPMFVILPLVSYAVVFLYRDLLNILSIEAVLTFGFSTALAVFGGGLALAFMISLVSLAYQHS
jgi:hypothetical protein